MKNHQNSLIVIGGPHPFDDPVQRTRGLIQYIRLRNQRAEAEQAKRKALKKQKMDAQAIIQNVREELANAEAEQHHWERFGQFFRRGILGVEKNMCKMPSNRILSKN
jgi:hypothetical protein